MLPGPARAAGSAWGDRRSPFRLLRRISKIRDRLAPLMRVVGAGRAFVRRQLRPRRAAVDDRAGIAELDRLDRDARCRQVVEQVRAASDPGQGRGTSRGARSAGASASPDRRARSAQGPSPVGRHGPRRATSRSPDRPRSAGLARQAPRRPRRRGRGRCRSPDRSERPGRPPAAPAGRGSPRRRRGLPGRHLPGRTTRRRWEAPRLTRLRPRCGGRPASRRHPEGPNQGSRQGSQRRRSSPRMLAAAARGGPMCDHPAPMTQPTAGASRSAAVAARTAGRATSGAIRADLRDIAIVAHVDHGKTTLVDAMLRQTGTFRANEALVDRVLDSMDLEREKGITILAKQTTVDHAGVRLNIVDTPGHADFGGEVERSLLMVDAVLLLVDAAEGPLPQTRYVLQKAMARRLPVVLALNKIDRSDARPAEVLDAVYELFLDLGADEHQIEFPIVYTNAKAGTATQSLDEPGTDLRPLLDLLVAVTPAPVYEPGHPLQLLVTNLMANEYVGRMAVGRIRNGTIRVGQRVSVVREEADDTAGDVEPGRTVTLSGTVTSLQTAHGIERVDIAEAGPGDIVSVAGLPEVTIGDTLTDPADPRPLPRLDVDEPTLRMTFGVNTSPLAGRDGRLLTSRQIKARLDREVLGNVSIEIHPTESGDTFEVRGRGELQLAVLIEQMRREGYELTISRPEVDPPRGRRGDPRAVRAHHRRHPARVHRRGPDRPGRPEGPPRAALDRRRRPGPPRVRPAGPWPHRLPRPAPDRYTRDGPAPSDRRGLRSVGGGGDPPDERRPRGRPGRDVERLCPVQPPGALGPVRRVGGRCLRGHDRRGEQPLGRHGREPDEGEEAHEHPDPRPRRGPPAHPAAAAHPRVRHRVHRRRRACRGDAGDDPAAQASPAPGTSASANGAARRSCGARPSSGQQAAAGSAAGSAAPFHRPTDRRRHRRMSSPPTSSVAGPVYDLRPTTPRR